MRIIQIEPSLCNLACWMCPYRVATDVYICGVANPWVYVFLWRGFCVHKAALQTRAGDW